MTFEQSDAAPQRQSENTENSKVAREVSSEEMNSVNKQNVERMKNSSAEHLPALQLVDDGDEGGANEGGGKKSETAPDKHDDNAADEGDPDHQFFKSHTGLSREQLDERLQHPERYSPETYAMMQAIDKNFEAYRQLDESKSIKVSEKDFRELTNAASTVNKDEVEGTKKIKRDKLNEGNTDCLIEAELTKRIADTKHYSEHEREANQLLKNMYKEVKALSPDERPGITQRDLTTLGFINQIALEEHASKTPIYAPNNENKLDSTDVSHVAEVINRREIEEELKLDEDDRKKDATPNSLTREELTERLQHPEKYSDEELKVLNTLSENFAAMEGMTDDDEKGISAADFKEFDRYSRELDARRQAGRWLETNFQKIDADGSGTLDGEELQSLKEKVPNDTAGAERTAATIKNFGKDLTYANPDDFTPDRKSEDLFYHLEGTVSHRDIHAWVGNFYEKDEAVRAKFVDAFDKQLSAHK